MNNIKRKPVIITSINAPSKAVKKFDSLSSWDLIIIGDKKTPDNFSIDNGKYLSYEDQLELPFTFAKKCPTNHYSRKNIGYLYAFLKKPSLIAESDDDNIPKHHWGEEISFNNKFEVLSSDKLFFNIYSKFTNKHIWPRGYPLSFINLKSSFETNYRYINVGVWQELVDNNPDVDAIYRLVSENEINFDQGGQYVLDNNVYCPFNSQNTFWSLESFLFMYLPCSVSFRFTDILRSYICQKLLWNKNLHLGFSTASVRQERNVHNLMKDFKDEITMYESVVKVVELLNSLDLNQLSDAEAMLSIYEKMSYEKIVEPIEMKYLNSWINDFNLIFNLRDK